MIEKNFVRVFGMVEGNGRNMTFIIVASDKQLEKWGGRKIILEEKVRVLEKVDLTLLKRLGEKELERMLIKE